MSTTKNNPEDILKKLKRAKVHKAIAEITTALDGLTFAEAVNVLSTVNDNLKCNFANYARRVFVTSNDCKLGFNYVELEEAPNDHEE